MRSKIKVVFIRLLLHHKANVEAMDSEGHTPLLLLVLHGSDGSAAAEVVQMLKKRGARGNLVIVILSSISSEEGDGECSRSGGETMARIDPCDE